MDNFYRKLIDELDISCEVESNMPYGVTAHTREDEENIYLFIENYNDETKEIELTHTYINELSGEEVCGKKEIGGYQTLILRRNKHN